MITEKANENEKTRAAPPGQAPAGSAPPAPPPPEKRGLFGKGKKAPPGEPPAPPKAKADKGGWHGKRKKVGKDQIIRIEDLESALANPDSEIDPESIVSMYLPQRRARRFGAALLRTGRLQLALLCMVLAVCILFIMSFMQEKMGNFTINLNRLELYRRGISISADGNFTDPTARLSANTVSDATNISMADLPADINDVEGDHNGKNYMAYTYFVRNAGKEDVGYIARITLDNAAKGAQQAARVLVWRNNDRMVYAAPAAGGGPEPGCTSFLSDSTVCEYTVEDFQVGDVDKYTVVIYLEGDDPECVDTIVGGSVQFSMNIDAEFTDNTNLLVKFIRDIVDTLSGNNPIDAAGTTAPTYDSHSITYDTRRNQ